MKITINAQPAKDMPEYNISNILCNPGVYECVTAPRLNRYTLVSFNGSSNHQPFIVVFDTCGKQVNVIISTPTVDNAGWLDHKYIKSTRQLVINNEKLIEGDKDGCCNLYNGVCWSSSLAWFRRRGYFRR